MLHGAGANSAYSIGWLFVIALSYAVGAVLYRRGPKSPDYIAAYNQCKKSSEDETERLAYEFIKGEKPPREGCLGCRKIKINIETSIHYVRVRELITIFENAWVYDNKFRDWKQPKLFDDITKAGREFGEKFCQICEHRDKCCPELAGTKEKEQEQLQG